MHTFVSCIYGDGEKRSILHSGGAMIEGTIVFGTEAARRQLDEWGGECWGEPEEVWIEPQT